MLSTKESFSTVRARPPGWCASSTTVEAPPAAAVAPAARPASPAPTTITSHCVSMSS